MESDNDVLQFWAKAGRHQYPVLSQVAAVYLSMSSSSVSVECMFSTTGLVSNSINRRTDGRTKRRDASLRPSVRSFVSVRCVCHWRPSYGGINRSVSI